MPRSLGRVALGAAIVAVALLFCGCAPAVDEGAGGNDGTSTDGGGSTPSEENGGGGSEGEEDPEQDRVRTGPTVDYGGPDDGDQGDATVLEPGVWCETVAVFWGGDPVPEGVRFTYTEAIVDRAGLEVTDDACGTDFDGVPLASCIGFVLEADASGFCSLEVRPGDDFVDGTRITFAGTLECPTAEACVAVEERAVEPGPPIEIFTPEGA
ncbi:hypothetical protein [Microbacterium sp. SSM24]|uniref:hypothetical protein n=1 Tax=Microbacterium sp. SSM24 TaxID=2991714 RepID=UPI0022263318|nr:hypothetical protein [Microbacterium sp. SSM24]MCW3494622.1 hypothetical protein [Microbacterium sp. SSM24]